LACLAACFNSICHDFRPITATPTRKQKYLPNLAYNVAGSALRASLPPFQQGTSRIRSLRLSFGFVDGTPAKLLCGQVCHTAPLFLAEGSFTLCLFAMKKFVFLLQILIFKEKIMRSLQLSKKEYQMMQEVFQVMSKYNTKRKFGIQLIHSHFPIANNEVLYETHEVKNRTLTQIPIRVDDIDNNALATSWEMTKGKEVAVSCFCCDSVVNK